MQAPELRQLLAGKLAPAAEAKAIEALAGSDPGSIQQLCLLLANQRRRLSKDLAGAQEKGAKAEQALAQILQPPLHPGVVLRARGDGRVDVVTDGRRLVVVVVPELAGQPFAPGDPVLLNSDAAVIVARCEDEGRTGLVATVSEVAGSRVWLRCPGDEELVATSAPELAAQLEAGDRVLYIREFPCVIERLPQRGQSRFALERAPRVRFEDIGGLDEIIEDIRSDLEMRLVHGERLSRYALRPLRGFILAGPPGVGKTMLAGAVCNHLGVLGGEARFLYVKPGALRGSYYGESEQRIRELFDAVRAAPGLVVIFFDELDSFGSRGGAVGQEIDGRVLGALLSELDGLDSAPNALCIGATNRLDLCDAALVREGRMGDAIYHVPRPNREATCQILERYLRPELPYADAGAAELLEAAASYLHAPAPEAGAGVLATATLAGGERVAVRAGALLNGALLAGAVERAKRAAARRELDGGGGVAADDLLGALDDALTAEAHKISAPHVARQVLDHPRADQIVRVELAADRRSARHRYLRAA